MSDSFQERLAAVRARVAAAAATAGRSADEIELIAISKTHPAERVEEALKAGLIHFGESKVQEARDKIPSVGKGIWHLVGHLQKNKVKEAVRLFQWIDSVDSLELAEEINRRAEEAGYSPTVLLQINVAGESAKFGLPVKLAREAAEKINALPRLELRGLMTIAPFYEDAEKARPCFAELRQIRDRLETELGLRLPVLSMGMSHDLEPAIEEGSTQVRVGTDLFGARPARKLASDDSFAE